MKRPSRKDAIEAAQRLIDGGSTPKEVATWARLLYLPENQVILQELQQNDPVLEEFVSTLGMADLPGDSTGTMLYGVEDFRSWLEEFLSLQSTIVKTDKKSVNPALHD